MSRSGPVLSLTVKTPINIRCVAHSLPLACRALRSVEALPLARLPVSATHPHRAYRMVAFFRSRWDRVELLMLLHQAFILAFLLLQASIFPTWMPSLSRASWTTFCKRLPPSQTSPVLVRRGALHLLILVPFLRSAASMTLMLPRLPARCPLAPRRALLPNRPSPRPLSQLTYRPLPMSWLPRAVMLVPRSCFLRLSLLRRRPRLGPDRSPFTDGRGPRRQPYREAG